MGISKRIAILGLMASMVLGAAMTPSARAALIIDPYLSPFGTFDDNGNSTGEFFCILFLPLCIFDQANPGVPAMTKQDLIDNGLSSDLADSMITQSNALAVALAQRGEKLVVTPTDTAASLSAQIRSVLPGVSADFVDFYVGQVLSF